MKWYYILLFIVVNLITTLGSIISLSYVSTEYKKNIIDSSSITVENIGYSFISSFIYYFIILFIIINKNYEHSTKHYMIPLAYLYVSVVDTYSSMSELISYFIIIYIDQGIRYYILLLIFTNIVSFVLSASLIKFFIKKQKKSIYI